jgi:pimeloyl-ACP methyl ester carboxylesterase
MPILLIRGQNSNELSQETYAEMLKVQPRAQGVVIPNAGHWVHSDQPDAFTHAVLDFTHS